MASKNNNLLLISSIYPPYVGGPATYVAQLADSLKRRGFSVTVVGNQHWFSLGWRLLKEGGGFTVFYANGGLSVALPALLIARYFKKRFGLKVTGDYAWETAINMGWAVADIDDFQKTRYSWRVEFLKTLRSWVAKQADFVIVPSHYLREMVAGWGIAENKIQIIYNGVTISKQLTKNNHKDKIIFSAGRLVPWKGFVSLINVFHKIHQDFPQTKLMIAGDGPMRKQLDKHSVVLLGDLSREEMNEHYSKACCFILFSGYEGLSHVLLEALTFSLPIIASAKGGNGELIHNGVNGWLVPWPNEELLEKALRSFLIGLNQDRVDLSDPGFIDCEKFSWETNIDRIVKVLFQ